VATEISRPSDFVTNEIVICPSQNRYQARLDVAPVGLVFGIEHPTVPHPASELWIFAHPVLQFLSQNLSKSRTASSDL
jgi:hypothetical protein